MYIDKNWFMTNYSIPTIMMSYCRNTTENNNWCKSKDIIDEFLHTNPQYFVYQKTYFDKDIFKGDPEIEIFPYFGDHENYYPTIY